MRRRSVLSTSVSPSLPCFTGSALIRHPLPCYPLRRGGRQQSSSAFTVWSAAHRPPRRGSFSFFLFHPTPRRWYSIASPAAGSSFSKTAVPDSEHRAEVGNTKLEIRRGTIIEWDPIERHGALKDDLTGESLTIANAQAFESVLPTHLRGGLHGVSVTYAPAQRPSETCRVLIRHRVNPITATSYKEKPPVDFILLGAKPMQEGMASVCWSPSQSVDPSKRGKALEASSWRVEKRDEATSSTRETEEHFQQEKEQEGMEASRENKETVAAKKTGEDEEESSPLRFRYAQHISIDLSSLTPAHLAHCDGPLALEAYSQTILASHALPSPVEKSSLSIEANSSEHTPRGNDTNSVAHRETVDGRTKTKEGGENAFGALSTFSPPPPLMGLASSGRVCPFSSSSSSSSSPLQANMDALTDVAIRPAQHLKDMRSSVLFDRGTNEWLRLRRALGSANAADAYLAEREKRRQRQEGGEGGPAWRTVVKERCTGVVLAWSSLHRTGVIKEGHFSMEERHRIRVGEYVEDAASPSPTSSPDSHKESHDSHTGPPQTSKTRPPVALIRSVHCFETALPSSLFLRGRLVVFDQVQYASHPHHLYAEGIVVLDEEEEAASWRGELMGKEGTSQETATPENTSSVDLTTLHVRHAKKTLAASLPRLSFPLSPDGHPNPYFSSDAALRQPRTIREAGAPEGGPEVSVDAENSVTVEGDGKKNTRDTASTATAKRDARGAGIRLYGVIIRWSGGQGIIESSNGKHYYVPSAAHFNQLVDLSSHKLRGAVVSFTANGSSWSNASSSLGSTRTSSLTRTSTSGVGQKSGPGGTAFVNTPLSATEIDLLCIASDKVDTARPMMELRPKRSTPAPMPTMRSARTERTATISEASIAMQSENGKGEEHQTTPPSACATLNEDPLAAPTEEENAGAIEADHPTSLSNEEEETARWKYGFLAQWSSAEGQGIIQGEDAGKTRYVLKDVKENIKGRMVVESSAVKTHEGEEEEKNTGTDPLHSSSSDAPVLCTDGEPTPHWDFVPYTPGTKAFDVLLKKYFTIGRRVKFMTYGTTGLLACNVVVLPEVVSKGETIFNTMEWKDQEDGADEGNDGKKGSIEEGIKGEEEAIVSPTCTSYWLQRMERAGYDVKEVSSLQNKALTPPKDDDDAEGGDSAFLDSEDLFKKDHWWTDPRKNRKFPNSNMTAGHLALMGPASMMNLAAKASDPKRLDKMVRKYQARLTEDQKALAWQKAKEMAPKYEACIRRAKARSEEPTFHFF